jgi:putative ABC transport system permease protein
VNVRDLFVDTFRTLWAHKVRTALTMFGIAWGVISITLMVAAGEGLRVGQQQQSDNLGKDLMIVFAGRTSLQVGGARAGRKLFWSDTDPAAIAREAVACRHILPELGQGGLSVRSAHNSASLMVTGSLPPFQEIRSITIGEGRFYDWADNAEGRRVAVLGSDARKQLFGSRDALGESVRIGDFPYTVIGVMAFKEQDSPPMPPRSVDQMLATPVSVDEHDRCKSEIRRALGRIYGFHPTDKEAVPVWDTVENVQRFQAMTTGMKYFLGAVGVVTLLLGGLGVMNVMLVAVRERTREIGVRKAVGATRGSILLQFFAETVLIVIFSGGAGMALALGLCAAVNSMKMPPFFAGLLATPETSLISAGLLGLIAVGAAMYPAARAASVDPIEALRFEAGG